MWPESAKVQNIQLAYIVLEMEETYTMYLHGPGVRAFG